MRTRKRRPLQRPPVQELNDLEARAEVCVHGDEVVLLRGLTNEVGAPDPN